MSQTKTDKIMEVLSVRDFGAVGDGTTDDTAAIQAAVDAITPTGGTLYFPPSGIYKITSEITVSSLHPVHLVSDMDGAIYDPDGGAPGIVAGANITGSWIKYTAPNSASRASSGGGSVRGLNFYDPTSDGAVPGSYTCTAALELNDFNLSYVENCTFSWINGSAILGEFVVMSTLENVRVRYSGAVDKPAIYFPSTSASYPAQSLDINNLRAEVCWYDTYLEIGANAHDIKIIGGGFEADTARANTNNLFLTIAGNKHTVTGVHFNRNTGSQVTISGNANTLCGNVFEGGARSATAITISGAGNTFIGNTSRSLRTGIELLLSGGWNTCVGNSFYRSGAIHSTAVGNNISNNILRDLESTTAVLGAGSDFWVLSTGNRSVVSGNVFDNNSGAVSTVGGVKITGTYTACIGNTFRAFGGSGNGAIGISNESASSVILGNTETDTTTLIATTTYDCEMASNMSDSAPLLSGSATYNPGSLDDGAGATTTVTVTGAAVGDYAVASFGVDLQGITLTAWVSSTNTVSVRFQNESGGVLDLAESTLKAKVMKR